MKQGKPSVEDIIALDKKLDAIYGARDAAFRKDEQFYELDIKASCLTYLSSSEAGSNST